MSSSAPISWPSRLRIAAGLGVAGLLMVIPMGVSAMTPDMPQALDRATVERTTTTTRAIAPDVPATTDAVAAYSSPVGRGDSAPTPVEVQTPATVPEPTSDVPVTASVTPPAVDAKHQVLAFLYPWFFEKAASDPQLSVHPTTTLLTHNLDSSIAAARLARASGIDGFVLSFEGGARQGLALHQTLEAAAATRGTATVLIETRTAGDAATVERWVREALRQSDHPAFVRVDGVPTVFAFASGTIPGSSWGTISDRMAAEGHPVRIIGDVTPSPTNRMAGQYRYNAALLDPTTALSAADLAAWNETVANGIRAQARRARVEPGLFVATVQPGWDDRPLRGADNLTVDRRGTSTYEDTWSAALSADPDWVVITSWNEWFEGTGIAPSAEHGDIALEATARWAARFKNGDPTAR